MAILKNQRTLSQYEYERAFNSMYQHFRNECGKIPIRRRQWLCTELANLLRSAHSDIMELSTGFVDHSVRKEWKCNLANSAIGYLAKLQAPLYYYWNIMQTTESQMQNWCEIINSVISLLYGVFRSNAYNVEISEQEKVQYIMYYRKQDIESAKFLSNMRDLHRYSHSKVIRAHKDFDGFESSTIISLVNDAWYHCIAANQKIPKNKQEYIERRAHLSDAISSLQKLNRPMLSLFILLDYSEQTMREWSDLLVEEIRLLTALQKSDKKRFGSLK